MGRKILLHIEFVYQFISLLFTYFSLANFYLTFYFVAGSLSDPTIDPFGHGIGKVIFVILRYTASSSSARNSSSPWATDPKAPKNSTWDPWSPTL